MSANEEALKVNIKMTKNLMDNPLKKNFGRSDYYYPKGEEFKMDAQVSENKLVMGFPNHKIVSFLSKVETGDSEAHPIQLSSLICGSKSATLLQKITRENL